MSILNVKSKKKDAISNFFMRKSLKKIQKSFFKWRSYGDVNQRWFWNIRDSVGYDKVIVPEAQSAEREFASARQKFLYLQHILASAREHLLCWTCLRCSIEYRNFKYSISEIDPLEYRNCKYSIWMISNSVGSDRSGEPSFSGLYAYHIPTNTWSCIMEDSPTLKSRIGHSMLFHSVSSFLNIESFYLHDLFQNFKKIISFRHFCNHKIEWSHITFIQAVFLKYESKKLS